MKVASPFKDLTLDALKAELDGGALTVYSVARPTTADLPVERSEALAVFKFASPAFEASGTLPRFVANPVSGASVGTPGFARACKADGTTVADLSAGPGDREIKFAEVSCSHGAPVRIIAFRFTLDGAKPDEPESARELQDAAV